MEFNKCNRCGCFFMSNNDVCPSCQPKDMYEMSKLKNYFENENCSNILNCFYIDTGISLKNLNRYLNNNDFTDISSKLNIHL